MKHNAENAGLYLLVDIDDLLVRSSDKLQEILDKNTNFKTSVLRMLEQLNRNCRYLTNEVKRECELAKLECRKPHLNRFLIFNNYDLDNIPSSKWYAEPVETCKYYEGVAKAFLNQFFEERDTFLEIDNMPKGEIKVFNYKKEMKVIAYYAELIANNKDMLHKINLFALAEVNRLISEAKSQNTDKVLTIPDYGLLVTMDANDIIKKNDLDDKISDEEIKLYQKPLENVENCLKLEDRLYDIITNSSVFLTPSSELVDYSDIHSIKNVNWDAVALVEDLIHSKLFNGVYFSTHHNGNREERAKKKLMMQILPEARGFIGQRFHDSEHNGIRRARSSKMDVAVDYLMVNPNQIVLLDDSKDNCGDCKRKNGTEILYKPITESEIINNRLEETGFNRIFDFKNNKAYQFVTEASLKQKIKIK